MNNTPLSLVTTLAATLGIPGIAIAHESSPIVEVIEPVTEPSLILAPTISVAPDSSVATVAIAAPESFQAMEFTPATDSSFANSPLPESLASDSLDSSSEPLPEPSDSPTFVAQTTLDAEQLQERLQQLEERQRQLEQEIQLLRQELETATEEDETDVVTLEGEEEAIATVETDEYQNVQVSVEALFLEATSSDLQDFAVVDEGDAFVVGGELAAAEYDDETALRYSLIYGLPNSSVDVGVRYTSFGMSGFESVERPEDGFLLATLANPAENEQAETASANIRLGYSVTDVEVGYTFEAGESLDVRLFGGLRFADIDQDAKIRYDGVDFDNSEIDISRDFTGYGLRMGGQADLTLGGGFSLFGRAAGSLLLGDIGASLEERDDNDVDLIASLDREIDSRVIPVVELAAGLAWENSLSDRATLRLAAGYELQNWFNIVDSVRFVDNAGTGVLTEDMGDLSLEGVFINVGLFFEF